MLPPNFKALIMASLIYFGITFSMSKGLGRLERRMVMMIKLVDIDKFFGSSSLEKVNLEVKKGELLP